MELLLTVSYFFKCIGNFAKARRRLHYTILLRYIMQCIVKCGVGLNNEQNPGSPSQVNL